MKKILLSILLGFSLVGCSSIIKPPHIKVLPPIQQITVELDKGCICGVDAQNTFQLIRQLRKSELYYIEQLTKYNEEFTDQ